MIKVHETAKQKVSTLMKEEGFDPSRDYVRVGVKSGGCSGLSYELKFDSEIKKEDKRMVFCAITTNLKISY